MSGRLKVSPVVYLGVLEQAPLIEVILIALLAVMSAAENWEDMEDYGNVKQSWLKRFINQRRV
jgi:hypothetical protein